jgi:hypothetical protein
VPIKRTLVIEDGPPAGAGDENSEESQKATLRLVEVGLDAQVASFGNYRRLFNIERNAGSPKLREEALRLRVRMRRFFEAEHGPLLREYPSRSIDALCADFADGCLVVRYGQKSLVDGKELAFLEDAEELYRQTNLLDDAPESQGFRARIYGLVSQVLSAQAERPAVEPGSPAKKKKGSVPPPEAPDLATAQKVLDDTAKKVLAAQSRTAKIAYFQGMAASAVLFPVLLYVLIRIAGAFLGKTPLPPVVVAVMLAGGVGAVLSVLVRLMDNSIQLDLATGRFLLMAFGACRPVVGALFGVASYLLIAGQVFPWKLPDDKAVHGYFFAGLALVAGFSERLAKDMLETSEKKLLPSAA